MLLEHAFQAMRRGKITRWSPAFGSARSSPQARSLSTGLVYIASLPTTRTQHDLRVSADKALSNNPMAKVYGTWTSSEELISKSTGREWQAAIRIVVGDLPSSFDSLAEIPDPEESEIHEINCAIDLVIEELRELGIKAAPILKDYSLFQRVARESVGSGSREFDEVTTSRPRYTIGMLDGYRKGFIEAKKEMERKERLNEAIVKKDRAKEEHVGEALAEYFESVYMPKVIMDKDK